MSILTEPMDSGWWRGPQSRLFIKGVPKQVAHDSHNSLKTIYRYKEAEYPVPAHQLFIISAVQADFAYAMWLAERAGAVLQLPPVNTLRWPTIRMLADLTLNFGRFFEISEKVQSGETLDDEEMREYQKSGEQVTARVWDLVQRAREQRREEAVKKEGK